MENKHTQKSEKNIQFWSLDSKFKINDKSCTQKVL